jgi:hypothetical protein
MSTWCIYVFCMNLKETAIISWFQTFVMFWMLYTFFWVISRCLNSICRCFGTLCLFHLHRRVGVEILHLPAYEDGTECSETLACLMWGISSSFDLEEETCPVSASMYSVRDRRQWPMQRIGARVTAHCDYNSLKLCFMYPALWNFYPNLFINMPQTQGHWQI